MQTHPPIEHFAILSLLMQTRCMAIIGISVYTHKKGGGLYSLHPRPPDGLWALPYDSRPNLECLNLV